MLHCKEGTVEIHAHHVAPLLCTRLSDRAIPLDARRSHENVEPAPRIDDGVDGLSYGSVVGDVEFYLGNAGGRGREIRSDDRRSPAREQPRARLADSAPAAGNERE